MGVQLLANDRLTFDRIIDRVRLFENPRVTVVVLDKTAMSGKDQICVAEETDVDNIAEITTAF